MVWLPRARLLVLKVAWPAVRVTPPGVRSVLPSLKSTVPVGVRPKTRATVAVKVTVWPNPAGLGDAETDVLLGITIHGSTPCVPSLAAKNKALVALARLEGYEPLPPGLMSATRNVPVAAPLLAHSSNPWVPSLAWKNRVPFPFARR